MEITQIAIVTGGARGLGRAIALELAQMGCDVAFTFLTNEKEAQISARDIESKNKKAFFRQVDSSNYEDCKAFLTTIESDWGTPSILINNAATTIGAPIYDLDPLEWTKVVQTNLIGYFNWIQLLSQSFIRQKHGIIVNISSINAARGREGGSVYNTTKAGVEGLTKTAARELGVYGITVNAVAPGFIMTESQKRTPEIIKKMVYDETALKRFATPEDIAGVVGFLCTPKASFITGQVIRVDGGQYI